MAKITYRGGEMAGRGNYWDFSSGERITIENSGMLPGDNETSFVKAHPAVVLAAAPLLGLLYAIFLPFIGIAMLVRVIFAKLLGRTAEEVSKVALFNWSPSAAYLAGKKNPKDNKADVTSDEKSEKEE